MWNRAAPLDPARKIGRDHRAPIRLPRHRKCRPLLPVELEVGASGWVERIGDAWPCDVFGNQRNGVLKVAITP